MHRTLPDALAGLIEYLDALTQRAPEDELVRRLDGLDIGAGDVAPFVRFNPLHYRRNLVCEGPWYEVLAICWRSGQRSPIHDHAQSTCGLRVISGTLTETLFEPTPCGQIKAVSSRDLSSGQCASSADDDIHQVSNLQPEGDDLVTLHIYSPPLRSMATYSLTDGSRGVYEPYNEHMDGSGI